MGAQNRWLMVVVVLVAVALLIADSAVATPRYPPIDLLRFIRR